MTHYSYSTASTLDGFLADDNDSLAWLLSQPMDENGPMNMDEFMTGIGAVAMGRTTYQWVIDHLAESGEQWPYRELPSFVFTHRQLRSVHETVRFVDGDAEQHRAALEEAAAGRGVWIVGGGDLATQFARAGMLDELVISYAPATVGSGRPLFTAPFDFELIEWARNEAFLIGRYRFVGER